MTSPPEIKSAVESATKGEGQTDTVAQLIVAWFEEVAAGNESLNDARAWERRVTLLLGAVEVPEPVEE